MHAAQNPLDLPSDLAALGDEELLGKLRQLLAQERTLSARWLAHLAEVDVRGLYREQAYASLFDYCVQALHLSEAEAYLRIRAARLGREFPRVLRMFASGELHLSAIKLLAPVLTQQNAHELLDLALGVGAPRAQPDRARALQGAAHREPGSARQDQAGPGPNAARGARRRSWARARTSAGSIDC
jgi:hypothetical protein